MTSGPTVRWRACRIEAGLAQTLPGEYVGPAQLVATSGDAVTVTAWLQRGPGRR